MATHKFSKEEIEQWRKEHNQTLFYINKNDSNLIVKRRYNNGLTLNLARPAAWLIIVALIVLIVVINIFLKTKLG